MQPALGWIYFSRTHLNQAAEFLKRLEQGVLDEMGMLHLHQGYADRFFPGTSVLQTRLRYVFFIVWIYMDLIQKKAGGKFEDRLQKAELDLVRRLKAAGEPGIIGGRTYPKPASQPPSGIYWNALGVWGLLRSNPRGKRPARATVHRVLAQGKSGAGLRDDDQAPLVEIPELFVKAPNPPASWSDPHKKLSFRLLIREKNFLRGCMAAVPKPGGNGEPSLLARLAEAQTPVMSAAHPWLPPVKKIADPQDRAALVRAGQAAALSAVVRAVYAALVETLRDRDGLATPDHHRAHLAEVIHTYRAEALKVDLNAVSSDLRHLHRPLPEILEATQQWLGKRRRSICDMQEIYTSEESRRKGPRARLPRTPAGRRRRAEWDAEKHPLAQPVHYRWSTVQRLLTDLRR